MTYLKKISVLIIVMLSILTNTANANSGVVLNPLAIAVEKGNQIGTTSAIEFLVENGFSCKVPSDISTCNYGGTNEGVEIAFNNVYTKILSELKIYNYRHEVARSYRINVGSWNSGQVTNIAATISFLDGIIARAANEARSNWRLTTNGRSLLSKIMQFRGATSVLYALSIDNIVSEVK